MQRSQTCFVGLAGLVLAASWLVVPAAVWGQSADTWRAAYAGDEATGPHVIGLWQFDAGAELKDASKRQADAKLQGAKIHPEGRFGSCLESFPGWPVVDQRHSFVVPNSPTLSPRAAFTLELWLQPKAEFESYKGNPFLLDKKYVAHTDYQLVFGPPQKDGRRTVRLVMGFGDESDNWSSELLPWEAGRWYHLAVTYDGAGTVRFFRDGEPAGGQSRRGRGSIAAGTHPLSIGDRLGSNYGGFPGFIDEVRITSGIREFRAAAVADISRRRVFLRGEEEANLRYQVRNHLSRQVEGAQAVLSLVGVDPQVVPARTVDLPPIAPGGESVIEYTFPTKLRPDEYALKVQLKIPATAEPKGSDKANSGKADKASEFEYEGEESFPVRIIARPSPQRMPVVMWGIGGIENVVKEIPRLKEIGFTHCLGLSADYGKIWQEKKPVPAMADADLEQAARMLDEALANDLRIVVSLSPGRWASEKPEWQRLDRKGQPYPRHNIAALPQFAEFFYNVGTSIAQTFRDFPAFEAALIHTEIRDGTQVSFRPEEQAAFRKHAGFDIPDVVVNARGVDYRKLADFPRDRIIPDDHPVLVFYRWFWKRGDGWNGWHSDVHRGFTSAGREDFWTFFDPAVRVPSLFGSGSAVDYLSHWTYSYPDPIRIGLCADELLCMARGASAPGEARENGPAQQIMKMTQLIWYRSQTAPTGKSSDQAARSPWEDFDPDAAYITIAPMHLREALWTKLSRPIQGIMYHGWQSLVPGGHSAYRFTHPETQHELARLVREVVEPLGPTLRQIPGAKTDVAMLESFTSQMFAQRGTYGWGHSWAGDLWHALQYAHLQPDIIYEETILHQGLDQYRIVVLPDCDVLPQNVAERLREFQKRGGLLIGDDRLAPGLRADVVIPVRTRKKRADEDKRMLLEVAAEIRKAIDGRYKRPAETSEPEVIPHRRRFGTTDYLFVVNDRREFGTYVGPHGLVMENGLPATAEITASGNAAAVYDLREARLVPTKRAANGALTWSVALGPCDGGLFMLTQQPIEGVKIKAAETARRGEPLPIEIQITDASGKPVDAVIPVTVEIRDPDGRTAERSGHHGAAGGVLRLPFELAPNDVPGLWEITVREGASGKRAVAYVRVQP